MFPPFFDWVDLKPNVVEFRFITCLLRGAREGSIHSDVTHGRVVMAVSCKTFQYSKHSFVLKQAMSALVVDSDMEYYLTAK